MYCSEAVVSPVQIAFSMYKTRLPRTFVICRVGEGDECEEYGNE